MYNVSRSINNRKEKQMITLKTLNKSTGQEVFDQVAKHLLTQKTQSKIGSKFRYRGDLGLKCAAGCLIADDEYRPEFEGKIWGTLTYEYTPVFPKKHRALIQQLQNIHDSHRPTDWESSLQKLAGSSGLEFGF